ncbi:MULTISPECIES: hypothetical protein [Dyella]|uniref:Uncharacterized protein n=2 Tax=Dyella TaxID=231454 RepID=A0A4R0YR79_9GAMM|nr:MULTISPECIES: hypothetical protein [Dyella]TBR40623.1 hypothetical protein EYV96_10860 [Dyella terrae]TCI11795.1 hypothetical protein EZM97_00010 [Dyella soli]
MHVTHKGIAATPLLGILIATSIIVASGSAWAFAQGHPPGAAFWTLWGLVFVTITVMWILADAKSQPKAKAHESGAVIFIFWFVYLPYYLFRTRKLRGLLWLLGFALLFYLGAAAQWMTYAVMGKS